METPSVPGVRVERPLPGRDAWRGRAGREPVDVVVIAVLPDPPLRRAALAALTPLVGPALGCVPRCRAAVLCRDGVAVITDAVDGRPLADLPALRAGHATAVGIAVTRALRGLHARGLAWGGAFVEILVDAGGAVHLPYDAVIRRRVAGSPATAAGDVTALAAVLARHCPDARWAALAAAPPTSPRAMARRLRRLARPRPLVLTAGGRGVAPHRAPPRRLLPVALLLGGLVGAGLLGWLSVRPHTEHDLAVAPLTTPATPDWAATLHGLDQARALALAGRAELAAADDPAGPAYRLDASTRATLRTQGLTVSPPVPTLGTVDTMQRTATTVRLAVTDVLTGYDYRRGAVVVASEPARAPHRWVVTLSRTAAGWRILAVT